MSTNERLESVDIIQSGCSGESWKVKNSQTEDLVLKPEAVFAYNLGKTEINLSDKMAF